MKLGALKKRGGWGAGSGWGVKEGEGGKGLWWGKMLNEYPKFHRTGCWLISQDVMNDISVLVTLLRGCVGCTVNAFGFVSPPTKKVLLKLKLQA